MNVLETNSAKDARVNGADLSKADLTVTPMY